MSAAEALVKFCVAVEQEAGGVYLIADEGDETLAALRSDASAWQLGAAYMDACDELGRLPVVFAEGTDEWDGQDALDTWNAAKAEGRLRS